MKDLINRKKLIDAIDSLTWYHVNDKGKLVEGANSNMVALYKAEDIYRIIESMKGVKK